MRLCFYETRENGIVSITFIFNSVPVKDMDKYKQLVKHVLQNGEYKENRTEENTISVFGYNYTIDLDDGFPLLTTKKMDGVRWNSLTRELEWYLSGEHHIRNLREHTKIWDNWADDNYNLPSAYGRFWRRYPVPEKSLEGEQWLSENSEYTRKEENGQLTFDQLQFVVDVLNGEHEKKMPSSRRLVINAWHPSNASVSELPPCHYSYVLNVQNNKLNLHLTQRSADIALGIPFNIAAYALLANVIAEQTNYELGMFNHTLVDAHVYCGTDEQAEWYKNNLTELQKRLSQTSDYKQVRSWLLNNRPQETNENPENHNYGSDQIPGLLEQLSRTTFDKPDLIIDNTTTINNFSPKKLSLENYNSHSSISFDVAE